MKERYRKVLSAVLILSLIWNLMPDIPYVLAAQTFYYIVDDIEALPDEVRSQQAAFGTERKELDLPDRLDMLIRLTDEDDEEINYIEIASSSNIGKRKEMKETATSSDADEIASPSNAIEVEEKAEIATPSDATPSDADDMDSNWRSVEVRWTVNRQLSIAAEYNGQQPGIYIFDAELADDRYSMGEALLPAIEVEVLEEGQAEITKILPLQEEEPIISVDISWGSMNFTYTYGEWNPDTCTYEDGSWTAEEGENRIVLTNNGSTDITISCSYEVKEEGITGSFADVDEIQQTKETDTSAEIELQKGHEKTMYLKLSGKPAPEFANGTVGTVRVVIGGGE